MTNKKNSVRISLCVNDLKETKQRVSESIMKHYQKMVSEEDIFLNLFL